MQSIFNLGGVIRALVSKWITTIAWLAEIFSGILLCGPIFTFLLVFLGERNGGQALFIIQIVLFFLIVVLYDYVNKDVMGIDHIKAKAKGKLHIGKEWTIRKLVIVVPTAIIMFLSISPPFFMLCFRKDQKGINYFWGCFLVIMAVVKTVLWIQIHQQADPFYNRCN